MLYTLAYIFRRADLNRAEFRHHYETYHAPLADKLLPRFAHYVRNHVIDSAGPLACPDAVSEFGFGGEEVLQAATQILSSRSGAPIREDELRFMDKPSNRSFPVERWNWGDAGARGEKYILWPAMAAPALWSEREAGAARLQRLDPLLRRATLCVPVAAGHEPCWMCWSAERPAARQLWDIFTTGGLPLRGCATVKELEGYPAAAKSL